MNRRECVISTFGVAVAFFTPFRIAGQNKTIEPDLGSLADGKGLNASKRTISRLTDGARKGVRLSEAEGEGPVYLPGVEFANGTIELDMKGKDVQGASFIGVAFHGVDGTTYDAIYFRPFNPLIRGRSCEQSTRGSTKSPSNPCRIRTPGSMPVWLSRAQRSASLSAMRKNHA
jgi:hypothetical protein